MLIRCLVMGSTVDLHGQRDDHQVWDGAVSARERHDACDANRDHEHVGVIAFEVGMNGRDGGSEIGQLCVQAIQLADQFTIVEVQTHPSKLN